MQVEVKGRAE